ncbi:tumor necrosis factor receptor superfamily member 14-like isoform X1 [Clupea harengus]|uniref:Tumor necrosis factor receptor superfamily member 14-like isoform X1 n=1 Tax=Clupea harengus TaxID=7950 RepID=A0A6P8FGL2_CLUHA|nr:tumor necrosis factor receptor superfamily member 14-like isoform X1 [Clupea harengus]
MSLLHSFANAILMSVGPEVDEEIMVKLVIIVLIIQLTMSGVSPACGRAEYRIGQECCPMCGPGYYVRKHCTEFSSTACVPCLPPTYTDAPNGLASCKSCTVCDSSAGLRVKRTCSSTSDSLCEHLEGHYCTDPIKDGCRGAVEHSKCSPGQYVKQTGTVSTDTVCGDCVGDTYSNGSFTSCRPHTRCDLIGLVVLREGSSSYDSDCSQRQNTVANVAGIIAGVAVLAAACGAVAFIYNRRNRKRKAQQEKERSGHTYNRGTVTTETEPDTTAK